MKSFDIVGIGHCIVDILIQVSEEELAELNFTKGSFTLVEATFQQNLLSRFSGRPRRLVSGGSSINSVVAAAELGASTAFVSCVGEDEYGAHLNSELNSLEQLEYISAVAPGKMTGTCLSLITPDSERTMLTCRGASAFIGAENIPDQVLNSCRWILLEGYMLSDGISALEALRKALTARENGTKIALGFSAEFVIDKNRSELEEIAEQADLLFANEAEAMLYTGCDSVEEAFRKLSAPKGRSVVVTAGEHGCYIAHKGEHLHVPAFKCKLVDLTGAGDMFAGALLYGLVTGVPIQKAARAANFLAMKVIGEVGARLPEKHRDLWKEGLAQ